VRAAEGRDYESTIPTGEIDMARKDKPEELNEIRAAVQELVRKGLVVDSGERRWSERTKRYEIVWALTGSCETLH
jgi:hypothetical protein